MHSSPHAGPQLPTFVSFITAQFSGWKSTFRHHGGPGERARGPKHLSVFSASPLSDFSLYSIALPAPTINLAIHLLINSFN